MSSMTLLAASLPSLWSVSESDSPGAPHRIWPSSLQYACAGSARRAHGAAAGSPAVEADEPSSSSRSLSALAARKLQLASSAEDAEDSREPLPAAEGLLPDLPSLRDLPASLLDLVRPSSLDLRVPTASMSEAGLLAPGPQGAAFRRSRSPTDLGRRRRPPPLAGGWGPGTASSAAAAALGPLGCPPVTAASAEASGRGGRPLATGLSRGDSGSGYQSVPLPSFLR
mmetsp:Transcript_74830/g.211465  ORF Transcript_74830/g.211465 Transcript_74830/m.211465 type:complete len:226 (+) Transcript_74830:113-790(+)